MKNIDKIQVLILAGGRGRRLSSIINDRPKPMADVNGYPFLEYLICQLKKWGLSEIIISIGYKGETIKDYFGNGSKWSVNITYSEENQPLGTGGAIKHSEGLIKVYDFIVLNGDSYLEFCIDDFVRFHRNHKALSTIALACVDDVSRYGCVEIDKNNLVISFGEKCLAGKGYINGGVYCFNKEIFHHIPDGNVSIEKEVFPKLVNNALLYGFKTDGYFIDIGTPESYRLAQEEMYKLKSEL